MFYGTIMSMENNGILLIRKPQGITSHDVVLKARRYLNTSKIGHTGTLDPMAEGLMLLTVGTATKILPYIAGHDKEYVASLKLGIKTDTGDITGKILEEYKMKEISREEVVSVLNSFLGVTLQTPPMYSAKKVNGKKLYELARKNVEIEREPVEILITAIELLEFEGDTISFKVNCSSGTYVRSLCEDIGTKLGTAATMTALTRTKIDIFDVNDAYSLENLEQGNYSFMTTYQVLHRYPYYEMNDLADVYNGKRLELDTTYNFVFITHEEKIIAAYEREEDGYFHCKRGLW